MEKRDKWLILFSLLMLGSVIGLFTLTYAINRYTTIYAIDVGLRHESTLGGAPRPATRDYAKMILIKLCGIKEEPDYLSRYRNTDPATITKQTRERVLEAIGIEPKNSNNSK